MVRVQLKLLCLFVCFLMLKMQSENVPHPVGLYKSIILFILVQFCYFKHSLDFRVEVAVSVTFQAQTRGKEDFLRRSRSKQFRSL